MLEMTIFNVLLTLAPISFKRLMTFDIVKTLVARHAAMIYIFKYNGALMKLLSIFSNSSNEFTLHNTHPVKGIIIRLHIVVIIM